MRLHPVLATSAAVALAAGVCAPGTAAAAAGDTPAAGVATSTVSLLDLTAEGRTLSAGSLTLLGDTLASPRTARIVATPLRVDGTAYGEQTITPDDSPKDVPSLSTAGTVPGLDGIAGLASPALRLSADTANGAASRAQATSLGGLSLLGLPVGLAGTLDVGSAVTSTDGAATKTLEITDLALPSIADLLAALGLDLSLLPVDVLAELTTALDLVTATVADAQQALDAAQAALADEVEAASTALEQASALAGAAQESVERAEQSLDDAEQAAGEADAAATALLPAGTTLAEALAMTPAERAALSAALQAALTEVESARAAVTAARDVLEQADTALEAADGVVDAAQKALDDLLATLADELAALEAAILGVLDDTPLVSLDSLTLVTSARVTSAAAGGQTAEVVGGEVVGLRVLGTDVLADVLGTSRIEVLKLVGDTLTQVNGAAGALTGALSEVLSSVAGLPALEVPAPQIGLLTKATSTGVADGFGTAATGVRALSVVLPAITVPDLALAAPGVVTPAAAPVTSSPVVLSVGTLTDTVRFRPAAVAVAPAAPPTTRTLAAPTRRLAATGASGLLAGVGLVLVGAAVVVRRRTAEQAER